MANDFEHGTRKTIALTVKAEKITADIFKSALSEFLNGNSQKTGRMTFRQLENKSPSGLEKIDVNSENNGITSAGAYKRDRVSVKEISCEFYGYELNQPIERKMSLEIARTLTALGWHKTGKRERLDVYGMQRMFYLDY